jgi:hypothetical protein
LFSSSHMASKFRFRVIDRFTAFGTLWFLLPASS